MLSSVGKGLGSGGKKKHESMSNNQAGHLFLTKYESCLMPKWSDQSPCLPMSRAFPKVLSGCVCVWGSPREAVTPATWNHLKQLQRVTTVTHAGGHNNVLIWSPTCHKPAGSSHPLKHPKSDNKQLCMYPCLQHPLFSAMGSDNK